MPTSPSTQEDTIFIDNVQTLVAALEAWHDHKVQILEHMMVIPSGTEMVLNDNETLVLDGDALKGFCAGITVALSELGNLPFNYSVEGNAPHTHGDVHASNDDLNPDAHADSDPAAQPLH